jgi:CRP/FNR family transcriptional regulator, cyclic AMP receptor protein
VLQETDFAVKFLRVFHAGEIVFEEGSVGRQMYVVNAGRVRVLRRSNDRQVQIGTLGPGDIFGEMALVDDLPRSATVVAAEENTRILEIDHALFVYLVGQQPVFALMVLKAISLRLRTQYEHQAPFDQTGRKTEAAR